MFDLESQIRKWKTHLFSTGSIGYNDIEELESHVRDSIDELSEQGINTEEAFLLAVRRLGDVSVIHDEFSKLSTEDLWLQLLVPANTPRMQRRNQVELLMVIALALLGGLLSKIPALFGFGDFEKYDMLYVKNAALFAFFPVAVYLFWKRSLPWAKSLVIFGIFPLCALWINLYPSYEPYHTSILGIIHLPIALLFLLIYFYAGPINKANPDSGWRSPNNRLNFVRFAGECFMYIILIGLGGIVLILLTMGTFNLIKIDAEKFITSYLVPFGFFGLFPVAAYLVEQKKNLIESIAPTLAKIFTPLFLIVLLSLITAFMLTPNEAYENRLLLIWFDVILALVLALTLYSMSAKSFSTDHHFTSIAQNPSLLWDFFSLALVICAVIVDMIALSGIVFRLSDTGFTANKTAALGENIILLCNLMLLCVGYIRYFLNKQSFQKIIEMQMHFLIVYPVWAMVVVLVFPPLFGFR
ncbi:MAG: permease prefix domain 1-containing protein [Sphaerochaeta sp.]|nr:permease prefix domain 1-containing protein [Sphaerochaeta sp.]